MVSVTTPLSGAAVATTGATPAVGTINTYNATSGNLTATLPTLSGLTVGWRLIVAKSDTSANTVTVACAGSDKLVDGTTASIVLAIPLEQRELQVVSIGGTKRWAIIGSYSAGLVNSTSNSIGVGSIELGHATDTTLSRGAAGVLDVEGVPVRTRVVSTVTSATTLGTRRGTDYVVFIGAGGSVTLPQVSTAATSSYRVKNISGSSSSVTTFGADATTVALLNCNGSNNSTTFTDSSSLAANWTANGTAAKIVTAQSKFGGASLQLDDGGGSAFTAHIEPTAALSNFGWGTGNFTVEMWAKVGTHWALDATIFSLQDSSNNILSRIYFGGQAGSNSEKFCYEQGGTTRIVPSSTTSFAWHHIAVVRSSGTTTLYIDGASQGTWADSTNYATPAKVAVGGLASGNGYFSGWLDDVRLAKSATYTTAFTPPTSQLTLASSEAIDSGTSVTLADGASVMIISDGTQWRSV